MTTRAPGELLGHRLERLAPILAQSAADALLITHPPNIAYLSGFFGSAGILLATADRLQLITDSRYEEEVRALSASFHDLTPVIVPPAGSYEETVAATVVQLAPARLGFESRHLTVKRHVDLAARLAHIGLTVELVPLDEAVEDLRIVKDPWELRTFREAGRRLSDVAKCILPNALAGKAERELAAIIEWELRQKGFSRPAFDTIVAAGPNSALPHYRAGDRRLDDGDLVVIDFGGVFRGYAVDMTRTVAIGRRPDARQAECLEAVRQAQQAAFNAARVGTPAEDVDLAARSALAGRGLEAAFTHGLGHGLGLEVHERPRLARRRPDMSQDVLAEGMVFTLEPGVYFPGWGGVRIEDDIVVTPSGPEWLTAAEPES